VGARALLKGFRDAARYCLAKTRVLKGSDNYWTAEKSGFEFEGRSGAVYVEIAVRDETART